MKTVLEPATVPPLVDRGAWKDLEAHSDDIRKQHLRDLFAADPERGTRMTAEAVGIFHG
jgi:glucose-6-phosphate isomerase